MTLMASDKRYGCNLCLQNMLQGIGAYCQEHPKQTVGGGGGGKGMTVKLFDDVKAPAHYARLDPEPIEVIEKWGLAFHAAQVLKYIVRAGHKKDTPILQDLRKAAVYLNRWIVLEEAKK